MYKFKISVVCVATFYSGNWVDNMRLQSELQVLIFDLF